MSKHISLIDYRGLLTLIDWLGVIGNHHIHDIVQAFLSTCPLGYLMAYEFLQVNRLVCKGFVVDLETARSLNSILVYLLLDHAKFMFFFFDLLLSQFGSFNALRLRRVVLFHHLADVDRGN